MFKNINSYLIFGSISIIIIILLFNKMFAIAFVILGVGALIWFLSEFLLKDKQKRINSLNDELLSLKADKSKMEKEIEDYSKRKLNISGVNTILELGLFEVNTNFKRTINKQFKVKDKNVQFIGVLNVDFIAKYGVDFRKIMYKIIIRS
ncbi:MAG: hypothetical protein PF484_03285 [Bacteroidales bacterium]|nr:hypothetical protein [Bacteroidales bacterium]